MTVLYNFKIAFLVSFERGSTGNLGYGLVLSDLLVAFAAHSYDVFFILNTSNTRVD
jgi:hypothetical protein